jgi:hypothetical protein
MKIHQLAMLEGGKQPELMAKQQELKQCAAGVQVGGKVCGDGGTDYV